MTQELINNYSNIIIVSHFNPDGDAIGSTTAFYEFLKTLNKKSQIIVPSKFPDYLNFLDRDSKIVIYTQTPELAESLMEKADLIICLDFNKLSRTEGLSDLLEKSSAYKFLVDHHPSPEIEKFDEIVSSVEVSSTCELLFKTLYESDMVNKDISKFPYKSLESFATGLVTDTNNFRNSIHSFTFEMASLLVNAGVDMEDIYKRTFGSYTKERMMLMGEMLSSKMVINEEYEYGFMVMNQNLKDKYCYQNGDSEGFVNLPLLIKDIEIAALFIESDNFIRVSLRSKGKYSVNELSNEFFNGGGHDRAAGGRLFIPIEEVASYFETSVKAFIDKKRHKICK